MAKAKTQYRCSECSHLEPKWAGKCPQCQSWNTLVEEDVSETKKVAPHTPRTKFGNNEKAERLIDIPLIEDSRIEISDKEFNRVLGGGIVRDSINVLTAPPGAGKSTLLMQLSDAVGKLGLKVYYASGEESKKQVRLRRERVSPDMSENVWFRSESCMDRIIEEAMEIDADVIIIDSIQTMYVDEIPQAPGSPTQVMACTNKIRAFAKNPNRPRAFFIVGMMTKEDELMGHREFEHAVDAVFYLEGERGDQLRFLTCRSKNRFGDASEIGFYLMDSAGMIPLENPSEYFMTKREDPIPGSALAVTREGNRNIVVEIESLLDKAMYGYPARVADGIKKDQLQMLCGILERRGSLVTGDKDVYVKVAGGLRLKEPAVNLGVIMSMVSSIYNKGIPTDTVFIGEVGLTGEIKSVPHLESRVKELDRLGFLQAYIPKQAMRNPITTNKLKVIEVGTLSEAITSLYEGFRKTRKKEESA